MEVSVGSQCLLGDRIQDTYILAAKGTSGELLKVKEQMQQGSSDGPADGRPASGLWFYPSRLHGGCIH